MADEGEAFLTPSDKAQLLRAKTPELKLSREQDRALSEALYTANEGHLFGDCEIDTHLAMRVWEIVEFAKTATVADLAEIKL